MNLSRSTPTRAGVTGIKRLLANLSTLLGSEQRPPDADPDSDSWHSNPASPEANLLKRYARKLARFGNPEDAAIIATNILYRMQDVRFIAAIVDDCLDKGWPQQGQEVDMQNDKRLMQASPDAEHMPLPHDAAFVGGMVKFITAQRSLRGCKHLFFDALRMCGVSHSALTALSHGPILLDPPAAAEPSTAPCTHAWCLAGIGYACMHAEACAWEREAGCGVCGCGVCRDAATELLTRFTRSRKTLQVVLMLQLLLTEPKGQLAAAARSLGDRACGKAAETACGPQMAPPRMNKLPGPPCAGRRNRRFLLFAVWLLPYIIYCCLSAALGITLS